MRMRTKATLFYMAATAVPLGVAVPLFIVLPASGKGLALIPFLVIAMCFNVAGLAVLVCPHCKSLAIRTPRGTWTPWVGSKCRYCHKPY